jgi:hypothetical protein
LCGKYSRNITGLFLFLQVICLILISSNGCKNNPNDSPEDKKPIYQEDISWPSLSNSPWPMYRADPQNTGRSRWSNTLKGIVKSTSTYFIETGLSLGSDASIYFTSTETQLYCLDTSGIKKWNSHVSGNSEGGKYSPVILYDGSILSADHSTLYKFNKSGEKLWQYEFNSARTAIPQINIGIGGVIYIVSDPNTISAVSGEGSLLWQIKDNDEFWWDNCLTAISPDGNTLYISGRRLSAIDLFEPKIKWKSSFGSGPPLVDSYGKIYCIRSVDLQDSLELVCLNSSGEDIWKFKVKDQYLESLTLTMDRKGNIYFGDVNVYSVNYEGKLNWKLDSMNAYRPIMTDNKNNIYVVGTSLFSHGYSVRCISESGSLLWTVSQEITNYTSCSNGALGYDKLVFSGWGPTKVFIVE